MRTSVSLNDELAAYVDEVSSSAGENDAEAIRQTIRHARDLQASVDDLETENGHLRSRVEELETHLERLQNEKRLILQDREENQALVRYVEDERSAQERWRQAGFGTKLKWRLFGMPNEEATDV